MRLFLPLLSLLVVCLQAGAPGPLAFVSDNPARPLGIDADLPRILADVTPGRPMVAVGNYWTTVLLVYARLGTKGGGESYAVAGHWEPMRPEIRRLLQSGRAFTLVCMPPAAPECLVAAERWSGLAPEPRAVTYTAGATLDSGGAYAVLAVAQGSGATAP